jgi:hypothetical protein
MRWRKKDYTYLLNHLNDFQDDLLTAKEDVLSPIKAFMRGAQRVAYDESITFLREEEANFAEVPAIEVQPRRDLAASAHPYRGNGVPKAKAAVSKLRAILADLLKAERDRALAAVDIQHARLQVVEDFALLNESSRAQVLALTVEARAASNPPALSPAFGTGSNTISHRINPAQLALASRLATPVPQPPGKPGDKAPPPAPPVHYTSASSLRPQCDLPYIATEDHYSLMVILTNNLKTEPIFS